ncbi:MAG TPA: pyridoxamine 5'-phosphate oxidase family protein [Candidatus Nanoarchaeia archaeon]
MRVSKDEFKKRILDYLSQNKRMSLATSRENRPWASTVMYAYDDDFNIYFLSDENTRKVQNLQSNPKIAATINEITGGIGKVKGIQLEGECKMVSRLEAAKVYSLFLKKYFWLKDYIPSAKQMFSGAIKNRLFKITPQKIYYLDDERFGSGGRGELVLKHADA